MLLGEYLRMHTGLQCHQLLEALRRQVELYDEGQDRQLGEILVEAGHVTPAELEKALRLQAFDVLGTRHWRPAIRVRRQMVH